MSADPEIKKVKEEEEESNEDFCLSASTMAVLQEFLNEQKEQQVAEEAREGKVHLGEDWQLSQFWYNDATSRTLVEEALDESNWGRVACLSTPSVYRSYAKLQEAPSSSPLGDFYLFEYDLRFLDLYGASRVVFYDYKQPKNIPKEHQGVYDFVLFDPPFLSEECLEKFAITAQLLIKPNGKIMALTGRRQASNLKRIFEDKLQPTTYVPVHTNLSNEFIVAINYQSKKLFSTTWNEYL